MSDINSEATTSLISTPVVDSDSPNSHIPKSSESVLNPIQNIDWQQRLDGLDAIYGTSQKIETIIAGDQFLHLPKEQLQSYVLKVFKKESYYAEKNAEIYRTKFEEDSEDKLYEVQYKSSLLKAEAYKAELIRMEEDPEYAYRWYEQQRDTIASAKVDIQKRVEEADQRTEQFFKPYRTKTWVSLKDRIFPLSEAEYREYIYHRYGNNDFASETAVYTNGQTTFPQSKEARAAVVKLRSNIQLKDESKPDEGLFLKVESTAARSVADHEAIHLITDLSRDEETVESSGTKLIVDRRGFRERYLDETGSYKSVSSVDKDFCLQALDEGTVVFFQRYLQYGQDLHKVIESLDNPYQGLSPGYIQAARAVAKLVEEMGITSLATNYINSTPFQFMAEVSQKLGSERWNEFQMEIRIAEDNLKS